MARKVRRVLAVLLGVVLVAVAVFLLRPSPIDATKAAASADTVPPSATTTRNCSIGEASPPPAPGRSSGQKKPIRAPYNTTQSSMVMAARSASSSWS